MDRWQIEALWRMFLANSIDVSFDYESELAEHVPPLCWIAGALKYAAVTDQAVSEIDPQDVFNWMKKQALAYRANRYDACDEWNRQDAAHNAGKRHAPADDNLLMNDGVFKTIPPVPMLRIEVA